MKNTKSTIRRHNLKTASTLKQLGLILILTAGFFFISPAAVSAQPGKVVGVAARILMRQAAKNAAKSAAARAAARQAAARAAAKNVATRRAVANKTSNGRYNPSRTTRPAGQRYIDQQTVINYCNYTGEPSIDVAIGQLSSTRSGNEWISRGWFPIPNGACRSVSIGMNYRGFAYVYAINQDSTLEWKGNYNFYVDQYNGFTLSQNSSGLRNNRNYKTVRMHEMKVNPGTTNYYFR